MIDHIKSERSKLYDLNDTSKVLIELLWGDTVNVLEDANEEGKVKVKARGITGYVIAEDLGGDALLELYFIDVGQGDGVLIITPDKKHILLDGGFCRKKQPHGKSAADFVDWKFKKDYNKDEIDLDIMISSHNDADHYGGLWDLINPVEIEELDVSQTKVRQFYHAGVSWWKDNNNKRSLGLKEDGYLVSLIDDESSIDEAMENADLSLQGEWASFLKCIREKECGARRIGYDPEKGFDYIPGFGPDEHDVQIKILGPIVTEVNNLPRVKDFGSDSQNTNGNSILLRLDYGRSRILLTGDLNKKSQQYILEAFKGKRQELAADVVKSCHHGSDDCSYEFLECVQASATIISSGDDENHAHPRPNIVAASGATGYKTIDKDEMITPLVFSTEISRSVRLGDPYKLTIDGVDFENEKDVKVFYQRTASGALRPAKKEITMDRIKIIDGIIYGLVNVRTDGEKIICATLNEGKYKWEIKKFNSRF
jgi:beta-lactamase superfamily II metal-dependent hydrolase